MLQATDSPIDALLFDFTGVLTNSPFVGLADFETETGAAEGSVVRLLMGDYEQDTDHPWHQLERGEIPASTYFERLVALGQAAGLEIDYGAAFRRMGDLAVRPEVVAYVRDRKGQGWRTALVTNNVKEFGDSWRRLLPPLDELFDVVVDSSEVGKRKPDPGIYLHALAELGAISPGRAVFVDDVTSNVAAARHVGLHGIVFDDVRRSLQAIDALLAGAGATTPSGDGAWN